MSAKPRCIIRGLSTLSAIGGVGVPAYARWSSAFQLNQAPWQRLVDTNRVVPVFPLSEDAEANVKEVAKDHRYHKLDRTAHLAVAAARGTFEKCGAVEGLHQSIGCIAIGSSRGPTTAIEQSVLQFSRDARVGTLTSPVTTAGNISSWVAQEYLSRWGTDQANPSIAAISTSMTCSSALHSLLVARSFVVSGMAEAALFGGSEACLTPFSIAQLHALRIYGEASGSWPCQPLRTTSESNSVVLGEGAGTAVLTYVCDSSELQPGDLELVGIGWAVESIPSPTGISHDAAAFEQSMRMAMKMAPDGMQLGAVIAHAPGTLRGDAAELGAVKRVLGEAPVLSTKHLTGHSYGASGMLSLELADALLAGVVWEGFPYRKQDVTTYQMALGCGIMINSAGFGGNAISLIVIRPTDA